MWYALDETYADFVSDRSDAAVLALLIPAMARGESMDIEGAMSERLYHSLAGPYQRVLQHVIPSLQRVVLHLHEPALASVRRASGVATGFSGGIYSYCVLADYFFDASVPIELRVTHLLFNNVGSHGRGGERLFRERYARLEPLARRMGLPFLRVNSNITDFYTPFSFQQTHTPRNASVAFLLQNGIGHYLYGSTYAYDAIFVGPARDMAYSDAIALSLLSTDALELISVGSERTRVEKTLRVSELADSHAMLDVCASWRRAGNCSACFKCMRTQLTLEIAGRLDRYAAVFDPAVYRRRRTAYVIRVLTGDDPLMQEIVRFARQREYRFPFAARLLAQLYRPVKWLGRLAILAAGAIRRLFSSRKAASSNDILSPNEGDSFKEAAN